MILEKNFSTLDDAVTEGILSGETLYLDQVGSKRPTSVPPERVAKKDKKELAGGVHDSSPVWKQWNKWQCDAHPRSSGVQEQARAATTTDAVGALDVFCGYGGMARALTKQGFDD